MGLFTELYAITRHTRLAMLVTADHSAGRMTVSVMPRAQPGAQSTLSTDLTLTATPEEFDTNFLAALTGYSRQLVPLLEQAAETSKALDEASHAAKQAARPAKPRPSSKPAQRDDKASCAAAIPQDAPANIVREPDDTPSRDGMKNRQPELF